MIFKHDRLPAIRATISENQETKLEFDDYPHGRPERMRLKQETFTKWKKDMGIRQFCCAERVAALVARKREKMLDSVEHELSSTAASPTA